MPSRIFLLRSGNIYRNLAFEACLYSVGEAKCDGGTKSPSNSCTILIWRSDPCVVIGRFQNPWKEVNIGSLKANNWRLARRYSGGGTVYHDQGNFNICFMEPRKDLDRYACMNFLCSTLQPFVPNWNVHVGKRYDLWVSNNSTGNFDLQANLETRASSSVRSSVINLNLDPQVLEQPLVHSFMDYLYKKNLSGGNPKFIEVPEGHESDYVNTELFSQELESLQSWSWIYGSSPEFRIRLEQVNSQLMPIVQSYSSLVLTIGRGALFDSIRLENQRSVSPTNPLYMFLEDLTETLKGAECRAYNWNFALDQFCVRFADRFGELSTEETIIWRTLRHISDSF